MRLRNSNLSRDECLSRYFPGYQPLAHSATAGLSGGSTIIERQGHRIVLRKHHDPSAPNFYFLRQYRALSALPASLAPAPLGYFPGWMAVEFLEGAIPPTLPDAHATAALLYHLHQQKNFGWRVSLLPLLERYWQFSSPRRRTLRWLRALKRLRRLGEPQPLRLAPLHMDVHTGNIIDTSAGLRLIDWEYAADGDIALELAAVWTETAQQQAALITAYARVAHLDEDVLARQVKKWQPWTQMLMTTWYEYRWQQTGDQQFIALADAGWRQFSHKG
ncbi:MAG TPA: thiamine kinase [Scandinavium sp.]|uniref:thiamine kinase n=1 Tax=Scandinavium sp. TaxID=2830653 RepID=UPI002E32381D|nr:thiamine kinase [Scandinavium sp.]HEX4502206.1 thiamine kinase [Scandinavium sp.]